MNDSVANIDILKNILIDKEFEGVCPPLTEDAFELLEENILSDGEVTCPLIIWDNFLIDGHHRRQIILKHPEIPFQIKKIDFNNKYEAIAWICKNQAGRRNLTPEELTYLIGKQNEAEKHAWGASDGFRGNVKKDNSLVSYQFDNLPNPQRTCERIAREYGIGSASVNRAEKYAKGVDAAEAVCPGVKRELLTGSLKATRQDVINLSKLPSRQIPDAILKLRETQAECEEKRRKAQVEKRNNVNDKGSVSDTFSSISELSVNMAEPKRRNDVSNVIGIISDTAQKMQATCEAYIAEFPELMEKEKPLLFQALNDLKNYLNKIYEEK